MNILHMNKFVLKMIWIMKNDIYLFPPIKKISNCEEYNFPAIQKHLLHVTQINPNSLTYEMLHSPKLS